MHVPVAIAAQYTMAPLLIFCPMMERRTHAQAVLTYLLSQLTYPCSGLVLLHIMGHERYIRSVNLLDLRQRQHHLSPIPRPVIRLTRVTLQVDSLEFRQVRQLRVECSEVGDLVPACLYKLALYDLPRMESWTPSCTGAHPELFQLCQVCDILDLFNHVVAHIERLELGLYRQSCS